jgi:hypothetical protein
MGSHDPFGHLKHKLWPKERSGVKRAIWLLTSKSWESTQFPFMQVTCDISLESSWRGLELCFKPHHNQRSTREVMSPKVLRILVVKIPGLSFGSLGTKCHLDVAPMESHRKYYKGEGGGFSQVWAVVSFVNLRLPVACPNTKSVQTMH